MPVYDISQTLSEAIAVWPGDQKFRLRWSMRLQRGDSCNVSAITMSAHTGTHMDAPYHFDEDWPDMATSPLHPGLGPARVFAVPEGQKTLTAPFLGGLDWEGVKRALFQTGSSHVNEDRFSRDFVCLTEDGASFLAGRKLLLVGTDAPSIEEFSSKNLRCHKLLGGQGIAILEGLRLGHVPPGDYELICLPLKLAGADGSPVRAVLRSPGQE
jgi:arylformamidase